MIATHSYVIFFFGRCLPVRRFPDKPRKKNSSLVQQSVLGLSRNADYHNHSIISVRTHKLRRTMCLIRAINLPCALFRLSFLGARRLFLTTYIDPFYPELNLHITSPDLLRLSMSPMHSSHYAAETKRWWMHFLVVFWQHLVDRIYSLREGVWDVWRDPPAGSIAWPPT